MFKSNLKYLTILACLLSFACQKQAHQSTPSPRISYTPEEIKKASDDLENAAKSIKKESADVVLTDIAHDRSRHAALSSRFSCESATKAARASSDVYPITTASDPTSLDGVISRLRPHHRPEHFAVFNAVTGGSSHSPAPRGYVEYVPSQLELVLENTPIDADIDLTQLNTHRDAFVVFRGTVGTFSGPDWLTNRDMTAVAASLVNDAAIGQVHGGFARAYRSARDELRSYFTESFVRKSTRLEQLLRARLSNKGLYTQSSIDAFVRAVMDNYQVVITGHSLGGALATLAAYDFALHFSEQAPKLTLMTFAAPGSLYLHAGSAVLNEQSLFQFAHLVSRGTQYGNQYSAVFFERNGDVVPEATARGNYYRISALGRYFYNGNSDPFADRPSNSGLKVELDAVPGREGVGAWLTRVLVSSLSAGILNPDLLLAHSMDGYRDDIQAYCSEMSQRQKCLNYDALEVPEQQACDALAHHPMTRDRVNQYQNDLSAQHKVHIMDHPNFSRIRHY